MISDVFQPPLGDLPSLRSLRERCEILYRHAFTFLSSYYDDSLHCFFTNEAAKKVALAGASKRRSLTNTAMCSFVMAADHDLLRRFELTYGPGFFSRLLATFLTAPWQSQNLPEFNIYTTPIVLSAVFATLRDPVAASKSIGPAVSKIDIGLDCLLQHTTKGPVRYEPYAPSGYLTYWCFRALTGALEASGLVSYKHDPALIDERCDLIAQWAENEMHRQMALCSSGDVASFDSMNLAFAVIIHLQRSLSSGLLPNGRVLHAAIQALFDDQQADGLWPSAHAIFADARIGTIYVFTCEMLEILLSFHVSYPSLITCRPIHFARLLSWLEQNIRINKRSLPLGWRSNHLPSSPEPEAWSTAVALLTVHRMERILASSINESVLRQSGFTTKQYAQPDAHAFDSFYDCEIPTDPVMSLKGTLLDVFVAPHLDATTSKPRYFSAVFFGPPGTAKTSSADRIAKALGWPLVYLQTSDFAVNGIEHIVENARKIFERLMLLERTVIVFDEVEEFVRKRRDPDSPSDAQSRMITTSMLSLIQELRSRERSIFIVTTNYVSEFDSAITRRGGRFDLLIPVLPITSRERIRLSKDILERAQVDYKKYWRQFEQTVTTMLDGCSHFAYAEWDAFVNDLASRSVFSAGTESEFYDQIKNVFELHKRHLATTEDEFGEYQSYARVIMRIR